LKKPRSYEKYENKSDRFGGSKSSKNPISVGEEYIVTIEETSKSGTGVAKIRGFVVLVNNSNSKVYFIYNKHKISYLP
jgi:hypothetical protein